MRKLILHKFLFTGVLSVCAMLLFSSCKDDSYLLNPAPVPDQSFSEDFDSATAVLGRGWKFINNSYPLGGNVWQNGGSAAPAFEPFSQHGTFVGFLGATYESTDDPGGVGVISNWMISPALTMQNGDKIVFYTRSQMTPQSATDSTDWANRLQVRINPHGTDYFIGDVQPLYEWTFTPSPNQATDDPGNYDISLLDINRDQYEYHSSAVGATTVTSLVDGRVYNATTNLQAYPVRWTRYEAKVYGLEKPTVGRFAFRYFVVGGGSQGFASTVGIDKMDYISISKN